MIEKGSLVRISGSAGEVLGTVEEISRIEGLPDIPGAPAAFIVRQILKEGHFDKVAAISYFYGDTQVVFAALGSRDGFWFDLKGQQLKITEEIQVTV